MASTIDATASFLGPAQIKVIVVPVHPIRKDTFQLYVHLLSQFKSVCLGDLTPPDSKTGTTLL